MSSLDDFCFMPASQRREALLTLARDDSSARLGRLGVAPADSPVYVVEGSEGGPEVGTRDECVLLAARVLGVTVHDPIEMQQPDGSLSFEVYADLDGSGLARIAAGRSEGQAREIAASGLSNLVGSMVMDLAQWFELQASDPLFDAEANDGGDAKVGAGKARRLPQWADIVTVALEGRRLADGWTKWAQHVPQGGERVRLKAARAVLGEHGSLRRVHQTKTLVRYELRAVVHDAVVYASYHDLVRAARNGIDTGTIVAWPVFEANAFVVGRELERHLRARGWRQLWSDEAVGDFGRARAVGGVAWVREWAKRPASPAATQRARLRERSAHRG